MATLGQQLKAAREAKGVSEYDAGIATKILTRVIVAMESDDFSGMAAPTYAKGFIRLYADYLGK
ncbi:MAG: helix-turn-helix domain-containing protein, partial [Kiritimatiellaceae bacterium]|nr:helix-turn-helix domain-containing protein [Kiritimatiellaceae bacterium]